jgi:hypothetical protein
MDTAHATHPAIVDRSSRGSRDDGDFHLVTVGWGAQLINGLINKAEPASSVRFSHIIVADRDRPGVIDGPASRVHRVGDAWRSSLPTADGDLLRSLEVPGVPTVHNMIMADRVLRDLPYDEALAYCTHLARQLQTLYEALRPSALLGGFDNVEGSMGLAVATKLNIPWFAMFFNTIPPGLVGFCAGMTPDTLIPLNQPTVAVRQLAERTLADFEKQRLAVPAYLSANNIGLILQRLPVHARLLGAALRRRMRGRFDKYSEYPAGFLIKEYARKRRNLFRLPKSWFYKTPPNRPFALVALHMQPESSTDVWAPFSVNQLYVVEALARSIPPTHELLVKLHKSAADAYSRAELEQFRRLPGVRLVSPFASSRDFVDRTSLVVTIQGTIALEGALLGKPVIVFGDSKFRELPGVSLVEDIARLPDLIRDKLAAPTPTREQILEGFTRYLSYFLPGCYADWSVLPNDSEIADLARVFDALRGYVTEQPANAAR